MKNVKFRTIHKVTLSPDGSSIHLPRKIRVRNVADNKLEQVFEILCAFARLIPGAKIIRKKQSKRVGKEDK